MANRKYHKSTIERTKKIRQIAEQYYEAGNNARCYKAVWKKYVYPIYPMCYRTFLNYLNIPTTPPAKPTVIQLSFWDSMSQG